MIDYRVCLGHNYVCCLLTVMGQGRRPSELVPRVPCFVARDGFAVSNNDGFKGMALLIKVLTVKIY